MKVQNVLVFLGPNGMNSTPGAGANDETRVDADPFPIGAIQNPYMQLPLHYLAL